MPITPITKKRTLYTDFPKTLTQHPVSGDVSRNINEEAVKESIKNLVLTDRFERPFQPDLGCDVRRLLFESATPDTFNVVKDLIRATIQSYEPRAELIGVDVFGELDSNEVNIVITFNVINREEPITLGILLDRIR